MIRPPWYLRVGFVLILGIAMAGLAACDRKPGEIRIGVIAYLSGEAAQTSGEPTVNAAQLAVQAVNDAGGLDIGGRKYTLKLIVEDIVSRPEMAVNAARKLIFKEGVAAIVGPQYSRDAIPVARVAEEARVTMITPMSTNPATTAGQRYIFRVGFVDDFQGWVMARFARKDLHAGTAAVLFDVASAYNKGIAEVFKEAFEAAGGKVTAFETYTTDNAKDFSSQLERIKNSGGAVLFLPNYPRDVTLQVQQARRMALKATIIGSDSWDSALFAGRAEFDETFCSGHWHSEIATAQSRAFIERYTRRYGRPPNETAALTTDAFGLLLKALQNQRRADSDAIRNGLYTMEPYNGVSGIIQYRDSGDPVKSAVIVRIKDGKDSFYTLVNPE